MLTALLRETLQEGSVGLSTFGEAMGLGAVRGPIAGGGPAPVSAPYDPFTAAATASFDSPWCAPLPC